MYRYCFIVLESLSNRMSFERRPPIFADRMSAGMELAEWVLKECSDIGEAVVLALPRGGVPVAAELAKRLNVQLDLMIVRKIGAPTQPEFAVGAIATGEVLIIDDDAVSALGFSDAELGDVVQKETRELHRRELAYRHAGSSVDIKDRIVILVDDGLATGATMRAAIEATRRNGAARVIAAVPHGAPESIRMLVGIADQVVCIYAPDPYRSVGSWYQKFDQTSDAEVNRLLAENRRHLSESSSPTARL